MPRRFALFFALLVLSAATPAHAIIKGTSSSLGSYTVRIVGPYYCTGVAIGRRLVVTAAHCARRGMTVGGTAGIAAVTRSAILDDGRRVTVSGDAAILQLTGSVNASAAPIGDGGGDSFTIAGYGTTSEAESGAFGSLHEASLVIGPERQLVDPNRSGGISASACFGDSGGPVMRGGMLVGVITRANYPNKRIACGFYTRWAPVMVSGTPHETSAAIDEPVTAEPRTQNSRAVRREQNIERPAGGLFGLLFGAEVEARRISQHKQALR